MRNLVFICVCLILVIPSQARIITVDDDGPADFNNIQAAIDDANDGDEIVVSDGLYTGEGNRDIDIVGKAITLRSNNGPEDCIVDCNARRGDSHRAFHIIESGETENLLIEGFTITNGYTSGVINCRESNVMINNCVLTSNSSKAPYGVVSCGWGSTLTVRNCTITGNEAVGISCQGSNAVIINCTVDENAHSGILCEGWDGQGSVKITDCRISGNLNGGIECFNGMLTVGDCIITGNTAEGPGGGIFSYKSQLSIENSGISGNSAAWGGGLSCSGGNPIISNCTISGNTAEEGGGIYCLESNLRVDMCTISDNRSRAEGDPPGPIRGGGGVYCEDASLTITDTTMADNTADGNFSGGGAILCRGSTQLEITNCTIRGNSAKIGGGGICCDEETVATITGCKIIGNSSEASGGGIFCTWETQTKINNCLVTGNSAKDAGGICGTSDRPPDITNCTIVNNIARDGYGGGIVMVFQCEATLDNCILWGNRAEDGDQIALVERCSCSAGCRLTANYCNVEGGPEAVYKPEHGPWWLNWDNGNIDADPLFIEPGYWDVNGVWVEGDYRLLVDSPCIDAGDPNYIPEPNETDLDGDPRIVNDRIDMGAYEFAPAIEAVVKIRPETINLRSKGKSIACRISLPEDYNVADIDPDSVFLEGQIPADRVWLQDEFAVAKFSRRALQQLLVDVETPTTVELLVSGQLNDGTTFEGTDTIRLIDGKKKLPRPATLRRKR